ncbi:MAG: M20/M25/M40 family metallo-hydrolase, partial [Anaerolineaceae bacterium]|nr:M20/M25/M40 family metallo-hydrolase [Anaerolineaceae bacterium]
MVGGNPVTLTTRNSYALFTGANYAFQYLRETLETWYPAGQIEEDPYMVGASQWKNLILTIPGTQNPAEVVILSAHYDSRSGNLLSATDPAPGADDNGSGSAALLEAARILHGQTFPRTIRLIWFTGEEQGLYGSSAYVNDHDLS